MTSMSYSPYDGGPRSMSRSMSRRPSMQSMNYAPPGTPYYPNQQQAMYPQQSYDMQMYNTPRPVPLTRPYDDHALGTQYFPTYQTPRPVVMNPMHRPRRHSTVSYTAPRPTGMLDLFRRPSSVRIKFKRKGSILGGINIGDAQIRGLRLSNSDAYYLSDMHPDRHDNVHMKVKWPGYPELLYHLPLDSYNNGHLQLETLARRVARSCVHYFQTNRIPVSWDRMDLKCLEELEFGVWQPTLTVNHIL